MNKTTEQMAEWNGEFGKAYTDRNAFPAEDLDVLYRKTYGVSRSELNGRFLEGIDRSARVLEVGSNIGNQLVALQKMGFSNLYGIELQEYAVELSKSRTRHIQILQGSVFDIPFKDRFFDLVFTSGLLTHISPSDLGEAMQEIHRCAKEWIWGFEAYAGRVEAIPYRGRPNLFWKVDHASLYRDRFRDLKLLKEEKLNYPDGKKIDSMFLLKRE